MSSNPLPQPSSVPTGTDSPKSPADDRTSSNSNAYSYSTGVYRSLQWHPQAAAAASYEKLAEDFSPSTQQALRQATVKLADEAKTLHAQNPKTAKDEWVQRHPRVWQETGVCGASKTEFLQIMVTGRSAVSAKDITPQLMMGMVSCMATPTTNKK